MISPPEADKKINLSYGLIALLAFFSFTTGGIFIRIMDTGTMMENQKQYLLDEIHGLRKDMEKEDQHIFDEIKCNSDDIKVLTDKHIK